MCNHLSLSLDLIGAARAEVADANPRPSSTNPRNLAAHRQSLYQRVDHVNDMLRKAADQIHDHERECERGKEVAA